MNQKFSVTGMTCSACSAAVERSVRKVPGVKDVNVSLLTNSMAVDFDETQAGGDAIIGAVREAGYDAADFAHEGGSRPQAGAPGGRADPLAGEIAGMKTRLIVSAAFLIPLLYVSMGHMLRFPLPAWLTGESNMMTSALLQLLTLPVVYVNRRYYQAGFRALLHGSPNMDSLIAIGSSAAVLYGIFSLFAIGYGLGHGEMALAHQYSLELYFESAATILTLITLGKFLETRSKGKTTEAITKLMDLRPKTAAVLREGKEREIPVEQVRVGDVVVVRPGRSIPVDGVVLEGSSSVDQSALTGESIPAFKQPGDAVAAATVNKSGYFKFRAQKVGSDTTLAKIIELVEEAGSSKAPIAKLADKISGVFVPVVIVIAVAAAVAWLLAGEPFSFALSIGIAVLVISCPCALGLATPVAIMVGTGRGASNGILIKSAEALQALHTVRTVVLDKTGTITEGKPRVTGIAAAPGVSEEELLAAAASIEKPSEHPLAEAVALRAKEAGVAVREVDSFSSVPGRGVTAVLGGSRYLAGNLAFMAENGVDGGAFPPVSFEKSGETPLYFAKDGAPLGVLAAADVVKPDSREAIGRLEAMGIEVVMLTGDNRETAEAVARPLGIGRVVAGVLPQDKEREIRRIQQSGKKVAMVGDGINDAPALMRADVGVAIGAGTDIAMDSADIVLIKSSLLDAVAAIELSRATMRNIKQNLFWAFFYNSIGIPLAAGVFYGWLGWKLSPMFAAAAMSMSSVCVVTNALRLRFFRPKRSAALQAAPPAGAETVSGSEEPSAENVSPETFSGKKQISDELFSSQKGENETMKKVIAINGMSCEHCKARVEKALNAIEGAQAKVDLKKNIAVVSSKEEIDDETLKKAVDDAGYEAVSVTRQKGLFGG